jgi:hypothetical protein
MPLDGLRFPAVAAVAAIAMAFSACERDPLDAPCATGLVVTEFSGAKGAVFVEVFVPGGLAQEIDGLLVRTTNLIGQRPKEAVIRVAEPLPPDAFAVLPATLPDDFLPDDGVLDLVSCGEVLDKVVWHGLPGTGSLAFDGGVVPSAAANDDEAAWCASDAPTPAKENPPCP